MSIHFLINDAKVCNKQAIHSSVLQGDSGGGVVVKDTIYGVHSVTGNETHAHAEDAGFMDVCKYQKWIEDKISK